MKSIVEFEKSKIHEFMESDDAYDYLFSGDPDALFIDRASIRGSDPIFITVSDDTNEVVYCKFHGGLYTDDIMELLNDFYNYNNGFKQLDINFAREYQGSNSILISRSQNKGFWEYRK